MRGPFLPLPRRLSPALPLLPLPPRPVPRIFSGGPIEYRRRENRGAKGAEGCGVRGGGVPLPAEKFLYFKYENGAFWCSFDGVVVKICLPIFIGRVRFLCLGANSPASPPLPSHSSPAPSLSSVIWRALASLKNFWNCRCS
jgi:hypothetical protein